MSRTTRYICHTARQWNNGTLSWRKTWLSLGEYFSHPYFNDPRDRWLNGYDSHRARSYIYDTSGWKEAVHGSSRKFCKRHFHKKRRRYDLRLIAEQME